VRVVGTLPALCLVLPALWAAPTSGAAGGGAISGTVTDATTHPPIALSGLASGNSFVEYRAASRALDYYVARYYNAKPAAAEANQVPVNAGQTTAGIHAALQPGGQITGTVTDAATGAPLPFIAACAVARGGPPTEHACAITNAKGAYALTDLAGGSYAVEFVNPLIHMYETQYYHDKTTLASANAVRVTPPNITSGIDAALQHAGTRPPAANGTQPTTGATGNPEASPPAMGFAVLLRSPRIIVRHGLALVRLECHATCRGKLALLATQPIRHGGKKIRRTVSIGSTGFTASTGRPVTIKIKLNTTGRTLLRHEHGHLPCRLVISQLNPGPTRTKYRNIHLVGQPGQ